MATQASVPRALVFGHRPPVALNPHTTDQLLRALAELYRVTGICPGVERFERAREDAAEALASWGVRA